MKRLPCSSLLVLLPGLAARLAPGRGPARASGDRMLAAYFAAETAKLPRRVPAGIRSIDDWKSSRDEYRRQLLEMLRLEVPAGANGVEGDDHRAGRAERTSPSRTSTSSRGPGLYVTANLYLPKGQEKPAPAILYVCGHGGVKIDGVSYGNKVSYQHHGEWLARNGYVCLTIDSLQLGEIESIHHGTYRKYKMVVEQPRIHARRCRGLELRSRSTTCKAARKSTASGSGSPAAAAAAYSWWIAAIDDRIKAAAPVAGITDLENHVVDGTVEGHCDRMFFVNTYRWDYPLVVAAACRGPCSWKTRTPTASFHQRRDPHARESEARSTSSIAKRRSSAW